MDEVRTKGLRVQFSIVTAVSDSFDTDIPCHYTTDVKITRLHIRDVHKLGIFHDSCRPHCVSDRRIKQAGVVVNF
jgi:hypothetical protein